MGGRPQGAEVIVVGGGVIGCAITYALACQQVPVLLVERDDIGSEASGAAAGVLTAHAPPDTRNPLSALRLASHALFPSLISRLQEETGIEIEHQQSGALHLFFTASEEEKGWETYHRCRERGMPLEWLSAEEVQEQEPLISPQVRAALFYPQDHHLHPLRLLQAFQRGAERYGARFALGQPVTRLYLQGGKVAGVETSKGRIRGEKVIVAAGCWSAQLLPPEVTPITLFPVRGEMLCTVMPAPPLRHILIGEDRYLIPRRDGSLLIGATKVRGEFDKAVTLEGIQSLLSSALRMVPALSTLPLREAWAGLRPCSKDRFPFLGPHPDVEGLFLATGHYRSGILLAPITGQLMVELLLQHRTSIPLEPFRIGRGKRKKGEA